jgi:S-adenosylmethionine:tRNA ribosyltransferase-isomerase
MDIEEFDYDLPQERIAQYPSSNREDSRLMVLTRNTGAIQHAHFRDLTWWMAEGDLLILNDTRVIPARIIGKKRSGGHVEILLYEPVSADGGAIPPMAFSGAFNSLTWRCLVRAGGRLRDETEVIFNEAVSGRLHRCSDGSWSIRMRGEGDLLSLLDALGHTPLPRYIRRDSIPLDRERYQTVYARQNGSVAAPTAGLHFTEELLGRLRKKGVTVASVTLQVGIGTFLPVRTARVEQHKMHEEYVEVDEVCCQAWNEARELGSKIVAVGTTTVRALETAVDHEGRLAPFRGYTSLFIFPGYRFRAFDWLITNFHLPRSTLLMLVMAFAGEDKIAKAYREAISMKYRFYSYGDAMLIQ